MGSEHLFGWGRCEILGTMEATTARVSRAGREALSERQAQREYLELTGETLKTKPRANPPTTYTQGYMRGM